MSSPPPLPAVPVSPQRLAQLVRRAAAARTAGPAPESSSTIGVSQAVSFAQQRLWFLERLHGQASAYTVPLALHIEGPLDTRRLEQELRAIVQRHSALRTTFPELDGQPVQVIHDEVRLPFDVSTLPADSGSDAIDHWLREQAALPFDLIEGPLIRAKLLRLDVDSHVLAVTMHHIVADGWSLGIFVRDLAALYEGRALSEPDLHYADFARWQRQWLRDETLHRLVRHWRNALSGELEALALPTDRPRPLVPSFRGRQHREIVSPVLAERLHRFCHRGAAGEQVTPFMVLLTVYHTVLARYSGQRRIVIGCPVANRQRREVESLIGFFVNTLPILIEADADRSLRQTLRDVYDRVLAAFDHQDLPFEQLVEHLHPERSLDRNPVFQAAFVMQNMALPALDFGGLKLTPVLVDTGTAKFDLMLEVVELGGELILTFEYATDLFDSSTIERFAAQVLGLLEAGLEQPEAPLCSLALLTEVERADLERWNRTEVVWPESDSNLVTLIERRAAEAPDAVAVFDETDSLTRGALNRRANALAYRLIAEGIGPESIVGVCVTRNLDLVVALIATMKAGGAFLPLDPNLPPDRLAFMIGQSNARLVLTQQRWARVVPEGVNTLFVDAADADAPAEAPENPGVTIRSGMAAYVFFTSGSTGHPKGVINTHGALLNRILWMQQAYSLGPDDSVLQKTPVTFDVSVWELIWPLIANASLVLARPDAHTDSALLAATIRDHSISVVHFVPSLLGLFLRETTGLALPSLRLIVASGEPMTAELRDACCKRFPHARLENLYGPTEAAIDVTQKACRYADEPVVSIGRPIANVRVFILDAHLRPVPVGAIGELFIGGISLARGYIGRPGLTAARFVPDPFFSRGGERLYGTGDLARFTDDGELQFLGRCDDQVKLRGVRIEPAEIEAQLCNFPGVLEAVVGVCDGHMAATISMKDGASLDKAALLAFLARFLPQTMIPATIRVLDALPRSASGKLDRSSALLRGTAPAAGQHVPVWSVTEARLLRLWQELLEKTGLGAEDDFFDLGGHSLLLIRLASRIREAFGIAVALRDLFQARTIAMQAALVDKLVRAETSSAASSVERQENASRAEVGAPAVIVPDLAKRDRPFPLNSVQQAYWVGRRSDFELGSVAAHLYAEIDCTDLSHAAIQQAFNQLVERHDMLRCIVSADGEQSILAEVPAYTIPCIDLRQAPAETIDAARTAWRNLLSHQILPADRWPLFDLRAVLLPANTIRLHVSFDLLVGDALSWISFCSELGRLARRPETVLPPLTLSFRDYLLAEEKLHQSANYIVAQQYWAQRIDTLPPAPDLPQRREMERAGHPHAFVRRSGRLGQARWETLKRQATATGLTPSVLLMAAFSEVLGCWTGKPHFTLNVTLFNRQPLHPEVNAIIGDFTSLTLLEIDLRSGTRFVDRALAVQNRLLDDLDHRQYGGVAVLRDLARRHGGAARAIMPVVFSSILPQSGRGQDTSILRELGALAYGITQTPQIYCDHQVYEEDGALCFNWDIVEQLFPQGLWDDMFSAYCTLLERLAEDPAAWTAEAPVDLPQWQRRLQDEADATTRHFSDAGCSLVDLVARQTQMRANAYAVLAPEQCLTYGELNNAADDVARWLLKAGAAPGMLVAIVMQKGWEQVVAALGILKAGAAYLPVDADSPPHRVKELLACGEATLVLTQSWIDARIDWPGEIKRLRVDDELAGQEDLPPLSTRPDPDSLAYVIFTSGSTGIPKGVAVTHRAVVNTLLDLNTRNGVWAGDRIFGLSSLSFDLSVYDMFGAFAAGATLVLPEACGGRDPSHWLARMQATEVSMWNSAPAMLDLLVDYLESTQQGLPPSLRLAMLSGDWIPVGLPDRVRARCTTPGLRIDSLGGATEASIWSIAYPISTVNPAWPSIPYGKALANQRLLVLDERLRPRPVWAVGALYIAGKGLASGYWRNEIETAKQFIRHPETGERLYATGDIGRWLPDGNIEFLGRTDDQIKIHGFRVELGEIEAVLRQYPGLCDAIVVATRAAGRRELVAAVVLTGGSTSGPDELRGFLRQRLPDYMVPSTVHVLESLPLTANGKVDRKTLAERLAPSPAILAGPAPTPGANHPVARIAARAAEILSLPAIAPDSNLLELGASSVDIVRLANALEREFSVRLTFETFYRDPTVAALAEACGKALAHHDPAPASAIGMVPDPAARETFKAAGHGRLRLADACPRTALARLPSEVAHALARRRSIRRFNTEPLQAAALVRLLACLTRSPETERYYHPSAGGLYPLRGYLQIRARRVAGLKAGLYYLDPWEHELVLLPQQVELPATIHDPFVNRPIFNASAFSFYLVAHLAAIEPLYGGEALSLCLVEAGYIGQLLMTQAPACGIGLCPIGHLDTAAVRTALNLDSSDMLVHSLLGGALPDEKDVRR
ncbi:putative non-ribosomal peptide synthetase protein [Paraburkholderia ribeironis]|uniref:Putative non-ribosomal peptide synthetase protein n=1 Tax=Paraburkholderia ribeironis TaxID=1247936 RepID=A0A1N7RUP1_9BURK|nr:non-ribosomal peptide synthetase [Paraburkholderia ribeironis]SIT38830.1 putative non-ribosomal peptide synthetase protein [Paraburkholderia ribeironis]